MPRHMTALSRVLVTLSTIVVGLVLLLPSTGNAVDEQPTTATHVVQPGDTLWEIAAGVTSAGDVREVVARIKEANGLRSSVIVPGQELLVPQPIVSLALD